MVLESTMVCLDNSDWMRNGDYVPTRLDAQNDAFNLVCGAKTQSNPENTVGVMTMAGKGASVLVTPTSNLGQILKCITNVALHGSLNFAMSLQVAQLALKHRQNKNQRQRIVAFVGSPIDADQATLVKLAKKLKKNNVSVDIVNFGEEAANTEKLEAFIEAVDNSGTSHLVTVPPGPHVLSDCLASSPVITGADGEMSAFAAAAGAAAASAGEGGGGFEFGVDPSLDPELALALRISMEEERQRQAAASGAGGEGGDAAPQDVAMEEEDEEMMLARALQMSVEADAGTDAPAAAATQESAPAADKPTPAPAAAAESAPQDVVMDDEDEELQRAMAMSLEGAQQETQPAPAASQPEPAAAQPEPSAVQDPDYLKSLITSLPGVDPNDERLKNMFGSDQKGDEKKDEKKDDKQ